MGEGGDPPPLHPLTGISAHTFHVKEPMGGSDVLFGLKYNDVVW